MEERRCQQCKRVLVGRTDKKFCDLLCSNTFKNALRPSVAPVEFTCIQCGKVKLGRSDRKYCTDACKARAYRDRKEQQS